MEGLAPGVAVRALGDTATTGTSCTPASSIISHTADSWPLPPSISSRSGHSPLRAVGIFLLEPGEAPLEHLAHHPEIVAGRDARLMLNLR